MYSIYDVFISYRRRENDGRPQGTEIAEALYAYLTGKGLKVFLDRERMENGPFPEQLRWQVAHAPNYIFIATESAMRFRGGPGPDYVAEEVRLALSLYQENPGDRMLLVVKPGDAPWPQDGDDAVPEEIRRLFLHRVLETEGPGLSDSDPALKAVLKNVTEVSRRNLWNAGYRWLEQARGPRNRFASLAVDPRILPMAHSGGTADTAGTAHPGGIGERRQERPVLPVLAHPKDGQDAPLMELIRDTPGHLYLIGEGGMGKTTALFSIMEQAYGAPDRDAEAQVPLFIELSRAPDTYGRLYENGVSTFILRAVYQQLRTDLKVKQISGASVQEIREVFDLDPETAVRPVRDLFTRSTPAPEYLLLLDGLNEVPRTRIRHAKTEAGEEIVDVDDTVAAMIIREIRQLMTGCPNVRIILTSRSEEQAVWGDDTTLLHLSGVKAGSVEAYLRSCHLPEARIQAALRTPKLAALLRTPLFLTMYASLDEEAPVLTAGEILQLYFHQKKESLYGVRSRSEAVDRDVRGVADGQHIPARGGLRQAAGPAHCRDAVLHPRFHSARDCLEDGARGAVSYIQILPGEVRGGTLLRD